MKDKLIDELKELKGVKYQLALEAELIKQNSDGEDVIAMLGPAEPVRLVRPWPDKLLSLVAFGFFYLK